MNQPVLLAEEVAKGLKARKWQLVTAESCTGGLISSTLTEIAGSSVWFERGFVTYSNLAKQEMLSVPAELISQFGAVSEETARAMALGALQHSAGHIAVSVTGIAGPSGGSADKPVGTVCIAWAVRGAQIVVERKQFTGTRQAIRLATCEQALRGILSFFH